MNTKNVPPSEVKSSPRTRRTSPSSTLNKKELEALIHAIESAGIQEFSEYIRSPLKMLWPNFVAGVAR
jgi:hypothetical protein